MEDWLLHCCKRTCTESQREAELHVDLSSEPADSQKNRQLHLITRTDSFDITFTPRRHSAGPSATTKAGPMTPRQRDLRDHLELPTLHQYPVPPCCSPDDPEDMRWEQLLETYQSFALELHTGMYLTQLTSNRDYSDIHCQLMEDLQTLKLDQSNGRIVEFPLTGVSKVYRIVKNDDKWYSAGSLTGPAPVPPLPLSNAEHIVVVEFMRRKLAFVFKEMQDSQRFLMCMELLIRRAQQKQAGKALRSLTPAMPPKGHEFENKMLTPRQVRETQGRCRIGDSITRAVENQPPPRTSFSPRGWCKESKTGVPGASPATLT